MLARALLTLTLLAAPALARADLWRWRDAAGRLHYSNVEGEVPPGAELIDGDTSDAQESSVDPAPAPEPRRAPRRQALPGEETRFA
jgi:hypothetical protein